MTMMTMMRAGQPHSLCAGAMTPVPLRGLRDSLNTPPLSALFRHRCSAIALAEVFARIEAPGNHPHIASVCLTCARMMRLSRTRK